MFEVSWGELVVVVGLGLVLVGKKDLPKASHFVGSQVGRVVGLLQGARVRADKYAQHNELKQLQNELKSGLRELDAVRSELAVSVTGGSRNLGPMVPGANRIRTIGAAGNLPSAGAAIAGSSTLVAPGQGLSKIEQATMGMDGNRTQRAPPVAISGTASAAVADTTSQLDQNQQVMGQLSLPPIEQTVGAVAEEEWVRQGIDFKSRAELGAGLGSNYDQSSAGSVLLSNLIRETLIFDQYDRTVNEQDQALQSRIDKIQEKRSKVTVDSENRSDPNAKKKET